MIAYHKIDCNRKEQQSMNEIKDNLNTIQQNAEEQTLSLEKIDYLVKQIFDLTTEDALSLVDDKVTVKACKELYNRQRNEFNILADMLLDYVQPTIENNKSILDAACSTLRNIDD